jgi:D-serine deaminase-like pyridoxal phosphate-dependent protein
MKADTLIMPRPRAATRRTGPLRLVDLPTPCLVLDRQRMQRNISRMTGRARSLGVQLRPHMKTAKSAKVAEMLHGGPGPITISTLAEADYFLAHGIQDMTYAVGIVPSKLATVAALQQRGARITLITDNELVARAIAEQASALKAKFTVLIELDVGEGRAGIDPGGPELLEIARALTASPDVTLTGVLAHAGHSYACDGMSEIELVAEDEREGAVRAATRLRAAGFPAPVVSVGSTPTALLARNLDGVTEIRPGNFVFFDLFQAGLGCCGEEDIAVSVLASVTGHHRGRNHLLIDAGSLALSKDIGANARRPGTGYGAICAPTGAGPINGLAVLAVHQEHGVVAQAGGLDAIEPLPFDRFPVGSRLRVLPNHVCMTAAMHERYHVTDGGDEIIDIWDRINGWTVG